MSRTMRQPTYEEACKAVGLSPQARHTAQDIEAAVVREQAKWSEAKSVAVKEEDFKKAVEELRELQDSEAVLLRGAQGRSWTGRGRGKAHAGGSQNSQKRAQTAQKNGMNSDEWVRVCRGVLNGMRWAFSVVFRHVEACGVPKVAVLPLLAIGLLAFFHGCAGVVVPVK